MARVGVDIDGVLYDFGSAFRNYLLGSCAYPRSEQFPEPTRWEFYKDWGITDAEFTDLCKEAIEEGELFRIGSCFPGAAQQIGRLIDSGHEVILITDREIAGEKAAPYTEEWLAQNCIEYHELHITADKPSVNVDYHIDDKPENYEAMKNAGVNSFLCHRPWNDKFPALNRGSLEYYVNRILSAEAKRAEILASANGEEIRTVSATGGEKGVKPQRYDLLPKPALDRLSEVYAYGATKYADHNWRKGYEWSKSYAAAMRHLTAFWDGETNDPESGLPHPAHAMFHMATLLTWLKEQGEGAEFDDRYKASRT